MGRPSRDLTKAQVLAIRQQAAGTGVVLCADPSCPNVVADDGASTPADADLCPLHRQKARNAAGVCPNCASPMATQPVVNALTGKPRANGDTVRVCTGCGYTQRPRRHR